MRSLALAVVLVIFGAPALARAVRTDGTPPNIVFILVDDLGWADLSCNGQTSWTTPRLDEMAREGLVFTSAYAGSTVCAPSRAALLIGNHTGRVYQRGNGKIAFRRDPHDITIATRLRELGYTTAMIGKSGVACNSDDASLPNDKGFDHFFGLLSHVAAHRHYPKSVVRNGVIIDVPGNDGYTGETFGNTLWVEDALTWLEDNHERPFFLHLSLTAPHADLIAPERYMAPFRGRFDERPHTRGGYYHQPEPRAAYAGLVAFVDESVGRVLDRLESLGVAGDTVVFFASDNGPHAEGGADPEAFDSNGPYRGGKRDLTEGGLRTPQIAWWPGTIRAGSRTDAVTAFWDFPATALDLAGASVPDGMDGVSIKPVLFGRAGARTERDPLYWEFYEQGGKQAVRMGRWKGIRLGVGEDREAPIALYDLEADVSESTDVSGDHPEIVARMVRIMREEHEPSDRFAFRGPAQSASDAGKRRRLRNERDELVLDRSAFRVVRVSSESTHNGAVGPNVLDDDLSTRWHTAWRDEQPPHPHRLVIDLAGPCEVIGVRLMSRQDASDNGAVRGLDVHVSDDPNAPGAPAGRATLRLTKDEQEILLATPIRGRYLTLVTRSGHAGTPFACFANIEVLGYCE
jgi:arylsulfatase A